MIYLDSKIIHDVVKSNYSKNKIEWTQKMYLLIGENMYLNKEKNRAKKKTVSFRRKKNHGERLVLTGQPVACQFYLNFITLQIGKVIF